MTDSANWDILNCWYRAGSGSERRGSNYDWGSNCYDSAGLFNDKSLLEALRLSG